MCSGDASHREVRQRRNLEFSSTELLYRLWTFVKGLRKETVFPELIEVEVIREATESKEFFGRG